MSWEVRTMRSGTSFFNAALFRKTFLRFWPIWALYTAGGRWSCPCAWGGRHAPERLGCSGAGGVSPKRRERRPRPSGGGGPLAAGAGLVCAMAVFSYLYSSRSACMMHALPLRREALFLTQYLAGCPSCCCPSWPSLFLTAATEAAPGVSGPLASDPVAAGSERIVPLFYSFAVFCAMFTGHLAALPVFYGVLNILAFVMTSLTEAECSLFLYGFQSFPSPVWEFADYLSPPIAPPRAVSLTYQNEIPSLYQPGLVAVYAAVGAALAIAALLLYRSRHIESASTTWWRSNWSGPCSNMGWPLCAVNSFRRDVQLSAAVRSLQSDSDGLDPLLGAGGLLRRGDAPAEVLPGAAYLEGSGPLAAAIVFLSLSVHYDWYGFESRVPDPSQVTRVTVDSLQSAPTMTGAAVCL